MMTPVAAVRIAGFAFSVLMLCGCGEVSDSEVRGESPDTLRRPNVLLYVTDTLRSDSLAPYGNSVIQTPAASRLAREGTLFDGVWAQSSWTRPSITSILTGLHPNTHGVEGRDHDFRAALTLLSEIYARSGYRTACITSNPNVGSFFGFDRGYDDFVELYPRREAGRVDGREDWSASDAVAERAIAWLEETRQDDLGGGGQEGERAPFFLFVLATDPHWPYEPPARFDRYRGSYSGSMTGGERARALSPPSSEDQERVRTLYLGEIAFNDDSLETLLDYLDGAGMREETIVAFTSDHGEEFWEHGQGGHGKSLFEEVLRIPLILRYPGEVAAGVVDSRLAESVDLLPTLLELSRLPVPEDIDGRSLVSRPAPEARSVYARLQMDGQHREVLMRHPWKLIVTPAHPPEQKRQVKLFDLARDPAERKNVARRHRKLVRELLEELEDRRARGAARLARIEAAAPLMRADHESGERDLPTDVKDALEALGYLEPDESSGAQNRAEEPSR